MQFTRTSGALLVATAMIVVATGCSPEQPPAESSGAVTGVEKDISQWTLPLDPFVLTDKVMKKQSYAVALIVSQCLEEAGMPMPVPYVDFDAAYEGRETTRTTLTEAVASRYGYHLPDESIPPEVLPWEEFRTAQFSDAQNAAWDECALRTQEDTPVFTSELMNFSSMFVGSAYQGAIVDPKVVDAAAKWSECMVPYGIADLPDFPTDMPSESVRLRFQTSPATGDDPTTGEITRDEVQLALNDVACRESSGFQSLFYEALWTRELTAYRENSDAFESLRAKIEDVNENVDATVAELATR